MKKRKIAAAVMAGMIAVSTMAGCSQTPATSGEATTKPAESGSGNESAAPSGEIKEFTSWFAAEGQTELEADNDIQKIIAEKTGAKCKETWQVGQTTAEAVGVYIADGNYPDFINGGDASKALYEAGALVAWDDYINSGKYPNIQRYYNEYEWSLFQQDDGHIYWCNPFERLYGEDKTTTQNGEAFWVQVRVLEDAGYPKIKTLDQYFDLLENYYKKYPKTDDMDTIPYTILCEDWRYFCLENAPEFLDGWPNDGSCIVDPTTKKIVDYNTTPTAKAYFKKLSDEYNKGIVDKEAFTQTYDEYIKKLCTGRVLGMCDQWWDFAYTVHDSFKTQGVEDKGYNYVPCGLTIREGMDNQWYTAGGTINVSSGIAVTTSCKDPDAAFKFIDDLLSEEILRLRMWGVEGVDYNVDENGMFYRTEEQRKNAADPQYKAKHLCPYGYFPQYSGTAYDGKNAMTPAEQPSEFWDSLSEPTKKLFTAYNVENYVQLLGSVMKAGPWYPMYSYSNNMKTDTVGGTAWNKMGECKHQWLPKVVMSKDKDFDKNWDAYMKAYADCKPEDFIAEMQAELDKRCKVFDDFYAAHPDQTPTRKYSY